MTIATSYENLSYNSPDGSQWGSSSTEKIGFWGKTPAAQRTFSSAVHVSSNLATSASFGATQLAAVNEIQATLVALGIWATA